MADLRSKSYRSKLAFGAGAAFNAAGFVSIVGELTGKLHAGSFATPPHHSSMFSIGAMFLAVGSLWIVIGARLKRESDAEASPKQR